MNKEIKEILDMFTKYKDDWYSVEYILKPKQCVMLLDYITNLQQLYENGLKVNQNSHIYITELEMNNAILKEDLDKANDIIEKDRQFYKCRMYEYVELKKENEFLKLNNPEMNIEHFRIVKENKRKIDNLRKENEELNRICEIYSKSLYNAELTDYKSRCKKAIEYIMTELITEWDIKNDGCVSGSDLPADAITPILNILNGSDKNE